MSDQPDQPLTAPGECTVNSVCGTGTSGRNAEGKFVLGNTAALKHGLTRFRRRGVLPDDVREQIDDFLAGVVADLGGADNLTTIEAAYVRRLARVEGDWLLIVRDLDANGQITPRGRERSLARSLRDNDRAFDTFAQRLGLSRRAKPVPTLADYVRSKQLAQDAPPAAQDGLAGPQDTPHGHGHDD